MLLLRYVGFIIESFTRLDNKEEKKKINNRKRISDSN